MRFSRFVLAVSALAFLAFGLAYVVSPVKMAALTLVEATTPVGVTDIRAVYGGLQIGIAMFLAPVRSDPQRVRAQLAAVAWICASVAICRFIGLIADSSLHGVHVLGFAFEIPLAALSGWALRRHRAAGISK